MILKFICVICASILLCNCNGSVLDTFKNIMKGLYQYSKLSEITSRQPNTEVPYIPIITDSELISISESLLKMNQNKVAKFVNVNYQILINQTKEDLAPERLITVQNEIWDIPTIKALISLFDNYEQNTSIEENVTPQEIHEENIFIDAIMFTPLMKHLMSFLKFKELVSSNEEGQKEFLKEIWFGMYPRSKGKLGSSGFEHIFLSEIRKKKILGLHNWIYFYTKEVTDDINYLGYMKKIEMNDEGAILKLSLNMKNLRKPVDSMFIGTSPEFEIAIYTLCFVARANKKCNISLDGNIINLRTYIYNYEGKKLIGSGFPEI